MQTPLRAPRLAQVSKPSLGSRLVVKFREESDRQAGAPTKAPLVERLGGPSGVRTAVDKFYEKVLADDRVNFYFAHTDMVKQRAHQAAFMTYAFGGPNEYKGKDMAEVHRHILPHLEEVHFNAIVENFVATLHEMDVPQVDIHAAVKVVASTKDQVLAK